MKIKYKIRGLGFNPFSIFFEIVLLFSLTNCISTELRISEFKFDYNNTNYVVRSAYCPNNPESCNQLISEKFVAVDMNQDRIIDVIKWGDITLIEAQNVYDYCLDLLETQNKVHQIGKEYESFLFSDDNFDYEIKTILPQTGSIFNEFSIAEKSIIKDVSLLVFIDRGSDGILNEIIKGGTSIAKVQELYNITIEKGLAFEKLLKTNGTIIVK